jgi:hypothetical protein
MGADKYFAFPISFFPICSTTKEFLLDGIKKLEQQSHVCGAQGGICRVNTFFQSRSFCHLYKAKDLSAPLV